MEADLLSPTARITFRLNERGQLIPLADGKAIHVTTCTVMSAVDKPTIARMDVMLLDGLIVEEAPAEDEAGK
jgi:hypothetical protein